MRCGTCGADNRDDARFCAACGVRILARCTTCDRELIAGARFCDGCGAPVVGVADAAAGDQTRKTVTIVFADLEGSTALQEQMDPESVRSLMGRYYALMRGAVEAHGGKVVKFVGDGTMAVFGIPEVAEDDAVRALRAATAMHAAFASLAQDANALALRVGVNTGEVVVDANDVDVVGDAVNVAARLESAAGVGEVLVGEDTWRLTRHAARFEDVPALQLRGRAEPVAAHRLVALVDDVEHTPAPFVGRAAEVDALRASFHEVVASGRPRLATVIGSPGVGKSRLVREVQSLVAGGALTLHGRCDPNAGATFAPVVDLLDDLGPIGDLTQDDPERDRLLQAVDSLTSGTSATPEETFWAVRRLLETAARHSPVVAVLDDVHWAEPLLLDLVEHLAEWLTAPVLLVVVARPELRELRQSLTEMRGRASTLVALEGLERDGTERLTCELLGTERVPGLLLDRLASASGGNPLFVRELVRMLVDDGVLVRGETGSEWTLAVDAADVEVPPTIQSLLASRLDGLRPNERIVLERAAVIGAEVYRGALVEIVPPEVRPELDGLLETLRRKELLEPAGTYWIDERVLRFHHALIREAAYRRLLKESRAGLHERVADWLTAKTGGGADHDETIGFHLEQAQASLRSLGALDEQGRAVAGDAAARLARAARRALDRDDLLAAAGLAGRALGCLDGDGDRHDRARADALLIQCEALLGTGDVASAGPAIEELTRIGAQSRRVEAWATCFDVQHTALVDPGALDDAEIRLTDAASVLDGAGDPAGAAKAHRVQATLLARLGRVADCEGALDRALAAARAAGDRRQTTSVLGAAPLAALWGPSPVPRAGGRCLDVVRLVRITTGALAVEATSIRCQAVLEAFRGRADAARSLIATARTIVSDLGLRHALLEVELFAGIVELCAGEPAQAGEHFARAQEGFTAMGVTVDAAQAAAFRGRAALALGHVDDALDHVATSEQLGGNDLKTAIAWRAVKAEVLAARGDIDEATRLAESAVALAEPTDALVDHADALAALGAVQSAGGDRDAAQRTSARARALYEQKGATALAAGLAEGSKAHADPQSPPAPGPSTIANAASRIFDEVDRLVVADRFDELVAVYAPSVILEDRRPGMGNRTVGATENIENLRVARSLGLTGVDSHAVAVRGDRLALVASQWHAGDVDVEILTVVCLATDGLYEQAILYDPADVVAAIEQLDELYAEQLDAGRARCFRAIAAIPRLQARRDWEALSGLVTDDVRLVDHRPTGLRELVGAEAIIEWASTMVELAPDYTIVTRRVLAIEDTCAMAELMAVGQGSSGGGVAEPRLALAAIGLDGRVAAVEFFAPEQREEAWARFRSMSAPTPATATGDLRNRAVDTVSAWCHLIVKGDVEGTLGLWADDGIYEELRPLFQTQISGRDEMREVVRGLVSLHASAIDLEVIALRAGHLVLMSALWRGSYEAKVLGLFRVNRLGLIDRMIVFEPSDMDAAMQELDELYLEGLSAEQAAVVTTMLAAMAAHNTRDWDALAEVLSADVVFVDHRQTGVGEVRGRDRLVELGRATIDSAPDFRHTPTAVFAVDERRFFGETSPTLTDGTGGVYEQPRVVVSHFDTEGTIDRYEVFDPEQLELAWTRYRALSGGAVETPGAVAGNAASEMFERLFDLVLTGRADDTLPFVSLHALYEDRRSGLALRIDGRDATVHQFAVIGDLGVTSVDSNVVGTRGDRLVLLSSHWSGSAFEVSLLLLIRLDDDGLVDLAATFDADDLTTAIAELDRLYLDQLTGGQARSMRASMAVVRAENSRDWAALRSLMADDLRVVDHRPTSWGEVVGADAIVEYARAMVDVAPNYTIVIRSILAVDDWGALGETVSIVHEAGGMSYEQPRLILGTLAADGRINGFEFFSPEQLGEAWERYRELSGGPGVTPTGRNRASDACEEVLRVTGEGHPEDAAPFFADDIIYDDRRPGMGGRLAGVADNVQQLRIVADLGLTGVDTEVLAVRGDRLALVASYWHTAYELTLLSLVRANDDGRLDLSVSYDPEDVEAAIRQLDELYAEQLGARGGPLGNAASRAFERVHALVVAGRGDDTPPFIHAGMRYEDRRPGMTYQLVGPDALVRHYREIRRIGVTAIDTDVVAVRGDRLALVAAVWSGSAFETPLLSIVRVDEAGLVDFAATYDADDLATAMAELDRLYMESLDPGRARVLEVNRGAMNAHAARRWEEFAEYFSEDVVFVDHRLAGYGELQGLDQVIEYGKATVDVSPDFRHFPRWVEALDDRCMLGESVAKVAGGAGGLYERPRLVLTRLGADGRIERYENFEPEQLDQAWARYRVLSDAAHAQMGLRNTASDTLERIMAFLAAGRSEDSRPLLSDAVHYEDRRTGMTITIDGRDDLVHQYREISKLGVTRVDAEVVAERGDRLALVANVLKGSAFEVPLLAIVRVDQQGRMDLGVSFDPNDLTAAMDELDRLHRELSSSRTPLPLVADNAASRAARVVSEAVVAGDMAAIDRLFRADAYGFDHRAGMQTGMNDRATMFQVFDLIVRTGVLSITMDPIATRGDLAALCTSSWRVSDNDYEFDWLFLVEIDEAGLARRIEFWDPDKPDEALAALDRPFSQ